MGSFVKIATFHNPLDAHFAQGRLEAAGLQSYIEGEHANLALSYAGTAIGGVRLLVSEADRQLAMEVLDQGATDEPAGVEWMCRKCCETVDAGFDVCWNCGSDRPSPTIT